MGVTTPNYPIDALLAIFLPLLHPTSCCRVTAVRTEPCASCLFVAEDID